MSQAWTVRNLVDAALLFSLDEHLPRSAKFGGPGSSSIDPSSVRHEPDDDEDIVEASRDFYFRMFFERRGMYQPRHLLEQKLRTTTIVSPYIVVRGPRGSGKSTLLRQYCLWADGDDGVSEVWAYDPREHRKMVFYVDLKRSERVLYSRDGREDHRVCQIVLDRLNSRLFGGRRPDAMTAEQLSVVTANARDWREYKLRKAAEFDDLFGRVSERWLAEGGDLFEIATTQFAADMEQCNVHYNSSPAQGRLELLLEFLADAYQHSPIIMLDNVDRYAHLLHSQLNDSVQSLANSPDNRARFVLVMRTSTARTILDGHSERRYGKIEEVEIITREEELVAAMAEPAHWDDHGDFTYVESDPDSLGDPFFTGLVTRRLKALELFLREYGDLFPNAGLEDTGESVAEEVGDIRRRAVRALQRGAEAHTNLRFKRTILRWHNYSIRSALAHQFRVYGSIVTGHDVLFPGSVVAPEGRFEAPSAHDFRTLL